jgi:hypothetical protein
MDSNVTQDELKMLTTLAMKLMLEAAARGGSMAEIEIDPRKVMGFSTHHADGAGNIFMAIAGGPSIQKLKSALALVDNPQ